MNNALQPNLIGRYFRRRDHLLGTTPHRDGWWLYVHVLGIEDNQPVALFLDLRPQEVTLGRRIFRLSHNWEEITAAQFEVARDRCRARAADYLATGSYDPSTGQEDLPALPVRGAPPLETTDPGPGL